MQIALQTTIADRKHDEDLNRVKFGDDVLLLKREVEVDEETHELLETIVVPKPWWANKTLLIAMFLFNFVFIGAMVFTDLEKWEIFYQSLYFVGVTLTTLGYGDLGVSDSRSKTTLCVYAFFGLGSIAWGIAKVAQYSQAKVKAAMARLSVPRGSADAFVHIDPRGNKPRGWCQGPHKTSRVYKSTLNPEFTDDDWELPIEDYGFNGSRVYHIEVYDWDRLGANDLIGHCDLDVDKHCSSQEADVWVRHTFYIISDYGKDSTLTLDMKKKTDDLFIMRLINAKNLPVVDVEVKGAAMAEAALDYSRNMIGALLSLVAVLFIGAAIFSYTEKWWFGDALYFAFITATTIGYGDLSPSTVEGRVLFFPYVAVALGVGAYVLSTIQDSLYQQTTKRLMRGVGAGTVSRDRDPADMSFMERHKDGVEVVVATLILICYLLLGVCFILIDDGVCDDETGACEQYSFTDGVYFSVVTLTTVGYGDILPTSTGSKVWVVFYSLFGLGILSSTVGIVTGAIGRAMKAALGTKEDKVAEMNFYEDPRDEPKESWFERWYTPQTEFYTRCGLLIVMLGIIVVSGAAVFEALEPDEFTNYGDACYFTIITITTIGYGDFSPKTDGGKWFFCFFIFVGLGFYGFAYAQIQTELEKLVIARAAIEYQAKLRRQAKLVQLANRDAESEDIIFHGRDSSFDDVMVVQATGYSDDDFEEEEEEESYESAYHSD